MTDRRNQRSAEAEAYRGWYKTARWKALRSWQLSREPLCAMCQRLGQVRAAEIVDHRQPHRGDASLFFEAANLQSLCKPHHDGVKQSWERSSAAAIGEDGWPVE